MSRADATARSLIDEHGLASFPVDLEKLAQDLGVLVVREDGDARLNGMLMRRDGQPVIGINTWHPMEAQRFALAHLLGHFKLHRGRDLLIDTVTRYSHSKLPSMPTDREEAEANRFAAALLAPEAVVRRMAVEADFDTAAQLVDLLAPRFELSRTVMAYRLMSLGVILDGLAAEALCVQHDEAVSARQKGERRHCGYMKRHPSHTFMRLEVLFQCSGEHGAEAEL